jgi:hypothetical protein
MQVQTPPEADLVSGSQDIYSKNITTGIILPYEDFTFDFSGIFVNPNHVFSHHLHQYPAG